MTGDDRRNSWIFMELLLNILVRDSMASMSGHDNGGSGEIHVVS